MKYSNFNEIWHVHKVVPSDLNTLLKVDLGQFKRLVLGFQWNNVKIGQFLPFQNYLCNGFFFFRKWKFLGIKTNNFTDKGNFLVRQKAVLNRLYNSKGKVASDTAAGEGGPWDRDVDQRLFGAPRRLNFPSTQCLAGRSSFMCRKPLKTHFKSDIQVICRYRTKKNIFEINKYLDCFHNLNEKKKMRPIFFHQPLFFSSCHYLIFSSDFCFWSSDIFQGCQHNL